MSNVFNLPVYADAPAQDPVEFLDRLRAGLPPDELAVEQFLQSQKAWFPYRRFDFVERTKLFVHAYDAVRLSLVEKNPEIMLDARRAITIRKHYLKSEELMAPWAGVKNDKLVISPRWAQWTRARRSADKRQMIYDDYVAGAILSATRRGWNRWPQPSQLCSDKLLVPGIDGYPDATIPAYEANLYAERLKLSDDSWLRAAAYTGHPAQDAYYKYFARELMRVHKGLQRAETAWAGYQRDGKIITCLSFVSALS